MTSIPVPFQQPRIALALAESNELFHNFCLFVDDPKNPETLRSYMRAIFPYIQEKWQIYEYRRNQLIRKYRQMVISRCTIDEGTFLKTQENALAVVKMGEEVANISKEMVGKIVDSSRLYIDKVFDKTCFSSDEFGYYSFNREGDSENDMVPFLEVMVKLQNHEKDLLIQIKAAAKRIVKSVINQYGLEKEEVRRKVALLTWLRLRFSAK